MNHAFGRGLFVTPGPSIIPERVLNAMHKAAPNIYEGPLVGMVDDILERLKKVARTDGYASIYISNGHGVWEAALHNTLNKGDKVLALANGRFGVGWAEMAQSMGMNVDLVEFPLNAGFEFDKIIAKLEADKNHEIKAVLSVQTDTSTSVKANIQKLRQVIDSTNHPALLLVDGIASIGCDRFEMDAWGVDVMVTGCQKGLMTPPGLAFVFHNEKANEVSKSVEKTSPYMDWETRINGTLFYHKFFGTPPTHHLFGLDEALKMIVDEEGIENTWSRHERQARAVWAAVDAWQSASGISYQVPNIEDRSCAVTTLSTSAETAELQKWCAEQAGLTLGKGLGENTTAFRIGHMGHMDPPMLLGALATIDAGLKALELPHGDGAVEAATKALITG